MKCTVDNVQYKSKPALTCQGCAANGISGLCMHLGPCHSPNVIWVKAKDKKPKAPKITVEGKTYKARPEKETGSCEGCAATLCTHLCEALNPKNECFDKGIIWVERVKKDTQPVEPTQPAKTVAWVNIYDDGEIAIHHPSEQQANEMAGPSRLACVRIEY